nr:GATA transcription factor 4-like [Ipomoea batatas]
MAIENSDGDAKSIGLCVPPDSLDDLDFFPNFSDDFISITDLLFSTPEKETVQDESQSEKRKRCYKPARSKTGEGRRRRYNNNPNNCGWKKRKCSHCETEDTPQWRMGPMGPNTLCNACGSGAGTLVVVVFHSQDDLINVKRTYSSRYNRTLVYAAGVLQVCTLATKPFSDLQEDIVELAEAGLRNAAATQLEAAHFGLPAQRKNFGKEVNAKDKIETVG